MDYENGRLATVATGAYELAIGGAMVVGPSAIAYSTELFGSPAHLVTAALFAFPGSALIRQGTSRIYNGIRNGNTTRAPRENGEIEHLVDSEQ